MKRHAILLLILSMSVPLFASKGKQIDRLEESAIVLQEIMNIPEGGIPTDLLRKSECIIIIPSMKKAAFGIGGNYGRGALLCRTTDNNWSAPVMVSITGGSFGLQIGGSSTDIILLVMNKRGINKLLESKFTIGGDATAAAGPKGRSAAAATDAQMRAEMLCYARSRGLFAGISIQGSVLKPERGDNEDLYGKVIDPKTIVSGQVRVPGPAKKLVAELKQYSEMAAK
jgi:SH3 domain-containing YSC84-like protein 1